MRRSTAAVIGTLAGTAVLAAARFGSSSALADGQAAGVPDQAQAADAADQADDTAAPTRPPADVGPGTPPDSPDDRAPSRSEKKGESDKAGSGGKSTGGKSTGGKSTGGKGTGGKKKSSGSGLADGTYRGKSVPVLVFGNVQVTLTVANGRATDITATYPTQLASKDINDRATVVLRRQALRAQSADIDSVSGATFTSEAYKESLASAFASARR